MARTQQVIKTDAGKNVNLRSEVYERLKTYTKQSNLEIKDFVNSVVEETLYRYELMKSQYPDLHVIDVSDERYVIADTKRKGIATLSSNDDLKWSCDLCKSTQCDHAQYVLLLPRMIKLAGMFVRLLRDSEILLDKAD